MKRSGKLVGQIVLVPVHLLRWVMRKVFKGLGVGIKPFIRWFDGSDTLSNLINSMSSSMATQRGLLLMIGTGLLVLSLIAHGAMIMLMVATKSFDRNLYWLCIPFALLHVGVLVGFTGTMLAVPLGQGYKDDQQ